MEIIATISEKLFGKLVRNEFHGRIITFSLLLTSFIVKHLFAYETTFAKTLIPKNFVEMTSLIYTTTLLLIDMLVIVRFIGEFWINKDIVLTKVTLVVIYALCYLQIASNLSKSCFGIFEYLLSLNEHYPTAKCIPLYVGAAFIGLYAATLVIDIFTDTDKIFG